MTRTFCLLGLCLALAPFAAADEPANVDRKGLALKGYDPVAYFPDHGGEPTKGSKSITAEYGGATYRFVSEDHRDLFQSDPEAYLPTYGGWCAYAMADGKRVSVDPKRFEVHDGKLYLFYRDWFTDTLKPWQADRDTLRELADSQWAQQTQDAE